MKNCRTVHQTGAEPGENQDLRPAGEKIQQMGVDAHALFLHRRKGLQQPADLRLRGWGQMVVQGDGKHDEHDLGGFLRVIAADGTREAKHASTHNKIIIALTFCPAADAIGTTRLKNNSIHTVFEIKFVKIIHPKNAIIITAKIGILDVIGDKIFARQAEMPVSGLLIALPNTDTAPINNNTVTVEVLVISRNVVIGFPLI